MKRCCRLIALCILVSGCDAASRSITGPTPPGPTDTTTYTFAGRIQTADGAAISGAVVQLDGSTTSRMTVSNERGEYRITHVRGFFVIKVTKDNYVDYTTNVFVAADQSVTFTLHRPNPILTLSPGVTLRGTIEGPPCDTAWDDLAPCVTVHFTPPATGIYELVLTWKGPSAVGLLIDRNPDLYWEIYTGEIRAAVLGQAGVRRELRLHAYHLPYLPEPFELTASLQSGS